MRCIDCKQYEEGGMGTGEPWNHCKIVDGWYFCTRDDCDLVDENGEDNGNYEREMQAYVEIQEHFDMNGDPYRGFDGNPW